MLNRLLAAHEAWYDVYRNYEFAGQTFPGYAEFHTHGQQYVLVKRAKLWEVASHEYIFFVETGNLDVPQLDSLVAFMKNEGITKVDPSEPNHMSSYVSLVIVASRATDEARKAVRKARYRKNFKLGINGWADLRVALLDLERGDVVTNAMGKDMKRALEENLKAPQAEASDALGVQQEV